MEVSHVLEVVDALETAGVRFWLDGGWGVDALVGEQTRLHADLDLALVASDLLSAEQALDRLGFKAAEVVPGLPARVVVEDERRGLVDLHPLFFDDQGNGWQQLSETGKAWGVYWASELNATGSVAGRLVSCLSPSLQFRFRLGYEWSDRDEHDVRLLSELFGLPRPPTPTRAHARWWVS